MCGGNRGRGSRGEGVPRSGSQGNLRLKSTIYKFFFRGALRQFPPASADTPLRSGSPPGSERDPGQEEDAQHRRRNPRPELVRLHLPEMVHHGQSGREIDEAVERLPPFPQAGHPPPGGGEGKRDEEEKGSRAGREVRAFSHVLHHQGKVQPPVEPEVDTQMKDPVAEGPEAQGPADLDHGVPTGKTTEGGSRKNRQEQAQGPSSCEVEGRLHRIRAQAAPPPAPHQPAEGDGPQPPGEGPENPPLPPPRPQYHRRRSIPL